MSVQHRRLRIALGVMATAVVIVIPFFAAPYQNSQLTMVIVFAVAILGFNFIGGFAGQINVGHTVFFGLGAFTTSYLLSEHGWPHLATLPVAAALGFVVAWIIGVPVLRLSGLYLIVVTLGLAVAFPPIVKRLESLTGGATGKIVPAPEVPAGLGLAQDQFLYFLCLAIAAAAFLLGVRLARGEVARAMVAARDNPLVAQSLGLDVARLKARVFGASGAYAAVAGSLYAFAVGFVSPESFGLALAMTLIAGSIVGGSTTVLGAVVGALFVQYVPRVAGDIDAQLVGLIFGGSLVLAVMVMPEGVVGKINQLAGRIGSSGRAGRAAAREAGKAFKTAPQEEN
jgi:branched-chain amino acid transport system permease protein